MIIEDESSVLSTVRTGLSDIELSPTRPDLFAKTIHAGRDRLARWRTLLLNSQDSVIHLQLSLLREDGTFDGKGGNSYEQKDQVQMRNLSKHLAVLKNELGRTSDRINGTFVMFMSESTVLRGEETAKEAHTVTKLAQLAIFFVPLNLVTSAFGMNITASTPSSP
jgi:Mg2+ and Co2+ transporter CorA